MTSATVYLAADHGGFELKNQLVKYLRDESVAARDLGPDEYDGDDDYPDYVLRLVKALRTDTDGIGVLICRSAEGVAIAANRNSGIRAAIVTSEEQAVKAREHNDANVACLSGDSLSAEQNQQLLATFLSTEFSGAERHQRRLDKIEQYFPVQ